MSYTGCQFIPLFSLYIIKKLKIFIVKLRLKLFNSVTNYKEQIPNFPIKKSNTIIRGDNCHRFAIHLSFRTSETNSDSTLSDCKSP